MAHFQQSNKKFNDSTIINVRHFFTAVRDPLSSDNVGEGFNIGSIWINSLNGHIFMCINMEDSLSVWGQIDNNSNENSQSTEGYPIVNIGEGSQIYKERSNGLNKLRTLSTGNTVEVIQNEDDIIFETYDISDSNIKINAGINASKIGSGNITNANFSNIEGVRGNIQVQLDNKSTLSHQHVASDITNFNDIFINQLNTKTTDDIKEGDNLYYTDERVNNNNTVINQSIAIQNLQNISNVSIFECTTNTSIPKIIANIPTNTNTIYMIQAKILSKTHDCTAGAGYIFNTMYRNTNNILTKIEEDKLQIEDIIIWDTEMTTNNNNIIINVVGQNNVTINWKAIIRIDIF